MNRTSAAISDQPATLAAPASARYRAFMQQGETEIALNRKRGFSVSGFVVNSIIMRS